MVRREDHDGVLRERRVEEELQESAERVVEVVNGVEAVVPAVTVLRAIGRRVLEGMGLDVVEAHEEGPRPASAFLSFLEEAHEGIEELMIGKSVAPQRLRSPR